MSDITYFGSTNYRNQLKKFGIKTDDRRRHMYILGKTGTGKTTLLENMLIQDIYNGNGVGLIDPHGESAMRIMEYIPGHRINDVVYFNPGDQDFPVAFNVLECSDPNQKHLVASGLMSVFKRLWANVWSDRMEYITNNAILALLDSPGNTLMGINRLFTDKSFRKKIIGRIQDPVVKNFWVNEFTAFTDRYRAEAIPAIQNKIGQLLSSSIIRNIVGQTKSSINIREIMDNRKILIMNLSKGLLGDDNSALLGAMMIVRLQLAAMSRIDIPNESDRQDFFLYVDEFQNFAVSSFAEILAEARKYRLNLILTHQYLAQLDDDVKDAIFGNVGTMTIFRVGAPDAKELLKEFEPYLTEEHLINIERQEIYVKLMIDGTVSKPFSARTLPPLTQTIEKSTDTKEKVIRVSRERYANQRQSIEEKLMKWSGLAEDRKESTFDSSPILKEPTAARDVGQRNVPPQKEKQKSSDPAGAQPLVQHALVCDSCRADVIIHFDPSPTKPILCRECLKKFRKGELDANTLLSKNKFFFEKQSPLQPGANVLSSSPAPPNPFKTSEGYIPLHEAKERLKDHPLFSETGK